MSFIAKPFGYVLSFLFELIGNYGLAIIAFTVITKLLFYPLQLSSKKSMRKTQKLQPKLKQIQKQYANNKQKQQEEMARLYQEEGVNPAGGCLPMLITLPIMLGLYSVIRQPLTYILNLSSDVVLAIAEKLDAMSALGLSNLNSISNYESQLAVLMNENIDLVSNISASIKSIDMSFLGLNLGVTPSDAGIFSIYIIIPIVAGLTSFLAMQVSQKLSGNSEALAEAGGSMKTMLLLSPLMSLYFGFILPAGLGLYWITGNFCMILQEFVMSKQLNAMDAKNETLENEKIAREKRNREKELEYKKEEQRRIALENTDNNKKG